MAGEKPVNVQDVFLNHVRKNKTPLTVFLINGVKLRILRTFRFSLFKLFHGKVKFIPNLNAYS